MNEFSSAEFNFGADPEAAKIVIEEMNTPITMVPWENAYLNGAQHEKLVDFEAHLRVDTPLASFLTMATRIGHGVMAKSGRQYGYCDEIAVAVAIDEKAIATKTMDLRLGIEVNGQMTRGQVVVDWCGVLYGHDGTLIDATTAHEVDRTRPTVHVIVNYDVNMLDAWMHNTVLSKKEPW
ncbi:hypothetical protein OSTOST_16534 [Ostertagia ostertagi]